MNIFHLQYHYGKYSMYNLGILMISCLIFFTACSDNDYTPKPRIYPKVEFPAKAYKAFDATYCDFTFEQPTYIKIIQDKTFFDTLPKHPCWFNIDYPTLGGTLHCTYSAIDQKNTVNKLINDSYRMAEEHTKRAEYIDERAVHNPTDNVYGLLIDIGGPAASPFQFFLTDSTNHFFRGSLYFNTRPNPDSLKPIVNFVKEDIEKMVKTFKWN